MSSEIKPVLRKQANWEDLYFYQKSNVLYQLTFVFTKRFLTRGDRTIDQMVQSARTEKLQQDFLQNGGIKEQMYRARINNRK